MIEVTDATDRQVKLERPARRVVSLVPSETASVAAVLGMSPLVGRTDFCVEPAGLVDVIPSVGGTKGFDVQAVKNLRPDLVLANKEENSRPLVQALIDAGLTVHVSFPCTVDQSLGYVETLCLLLGVCPDRAEPLIACRAQVDAARRAKRQESLPVFVPIWKDPWMTFDDGAYASGLLELCGAHNVFSGRRRRYPLAADLGRGVAWSADRVQRRDTRYPRVRLEEAIERGARAVLLPDEPYAFTDDDARAIREIPSARPLIVYPVQGKDLFWYGTHLARAVPRLRVQIAALRSSRVGSVAHN
jgi:hypothetical protein